MFREGAGLMAMAAGERLIGGGSLCGQCPVQFTFNRFKFLPIQAPTLLMAWHRPCLFQEMKHAEDLHSVLEELGEGLGAAASKKMLAVCGSVSGALQKDECHCFK